MRWMIDSTPSRIRSAVNYVARHDHAKHTGPPSAPVVVYVTDAGVVEDDVACRFAVSKELDLRGRQTFDKSDCGALGLPDLINFSCSCDRIRSV